MVTRTHLYGIASGAIFIGIVTACLWPFGAPKNQVSWLEQCPGLRFGEYGTIISRGPLLPSSGLSRDGWTLELWLRPGEAYQDGTIVAFYDPYRARGFSLRQANADLVACERLWSTNLPAGGRTVDVLRVFRGRPRIFLTLASGVDGTRIFVNGKLVRLDSDFQISRDDFSGRMVVGNSPVDNDGWSGDLPGLAFYDSALTDSEVFRNYSSWTEAGRPDITREQSLAALFLFDEGSGSVVHDEVESAADLYVPPRYLELHHAVLKRPWDEYRADLDYWKSAVINIGGFVPLGFFIYAYLFLGLQRPRAALTTILVGGLLSLTVEILQSFLPTRDSGMTDIITNSLGTALGAGLCRCTSIVCEALRNNRNLHVRRFAGLFTPGTAEPAVMAERVSIEHYRI